MHFVDGVLYSHEPNSKADMYLFSLVEREEDFFQVLFWYGVLLADTSWSRQGHGPPPKPIHDGS